MFSCLCSYKTNFAVRNQCLLRLDGIGYLREHVFALCVGSEREALSFQRKLPDLLSPE